MTRALRFLPEVEEDAAAAAAAAYAWYEAKSSGLGESFLRVFSNAAREIPSNPSLFQ